MEERRFVMFTLIVYFIQLAPSERPFLAKMAGQQTGLNDRAKIRFR